MSYILSLLDGTNKKSKGNADQVTEMVQNDASLIDELISGLFIENNVINIRTGVVLRQLSKRSPTLITLYKEQILEVFNKSESPNLLMELVQLFHCIQFTNEEIPFYYNALEKCIGNNKNKFLTAHSMDAITQLALTYDFMITETRELIFGLTATGAPSMQARGRRMLKLIDRGLNER